MRLFEERFATRVATLEGEGNRPSYRNYLKVVTDCCDEVFPKGNAYHGRKKEVYWWCSSVSEKCKSCMKSRRNMTRANRGGTEEIRAEAARQYKTCRKEYKREILRAKKKS